MRADGWEPRRGRRAILGGRGGPLASPQPVVGCGTRRVVAGVAPAGSVHDGVPPAARRLDACRRHA